MATRNLDTNRGTAAFPQYKCCCAMIHVKQGTLMIGVVSAIINVVVLLHAVISFSEKSSTFNIVDVLVEIICVVLLLVAVLKDIKYLLLPFLFIKVLDVIIYVILALLCIWAAVDTDNFFGTFFKEEYMSPEVFKVEKSNPESGKSLFRLVIITAATVLILFLCLTLWFISVVYRCYQYYTDMEKFNTPVSYNRQQGALVH